MNKIKRGSTLELIYYLALASVVILIGLTTVGVGFTLEYITKAADWYAPTQKQGTFPFTQITPVPTTPATLTPTQPEAQNNPPPPATDNAPPPSEQYCVDEEPGSVVVEPCDDKTRCDVAHGSGGPSGNCDTVVGWEHNIIESMLSGTGMYGRELLTNLPATIQSFCYTASSYDPYPSTFNVIDSYNLAGLSGFDRGTHAAATALEGAWKSTTGYTTSSSAQGLTPGDVIFFPNEGSTKPAHVGIVNTVEIDTNGDGDIWFLHTGGSYYLGKIMVAGWNFGASSTGHSKVTFASNQSKGADTTTGETVCYCGGGVCYRWTF